MVGHDSVGLAHHAHAACAVLRGTRVAQRELGVVLQHLDRHHHVLRYAVSVVLGQHAQVLQHGTIKLIDVDAIRQIRLGNLLRHPVLAEPLP